MGRTILLVVFVLMVLVSCAPATERTASFDVSAIQSVSILRNRDEITATWGISGKLLSYVTWIEFYDEEGVSLLVSPRQYAHEKVILPTEETLYSDTFGIREVADFVREGARETYALLFHVTIQSPEGETIRSEPNHVTFFTTTVEDEK